jgi:UDPglucose 6-dehydrogenase
MYTPLQDADALVICTEWSIFRSPNFEKVKSLLKQPIIFDGRNLYNTQDMEREGFAYTSIGRNKVKP